MLGLLAVVACAFPANHVTRDSSRANVMGTYILTGGTDEDGVIRRYNRATCFLKVVASGRDFDVISCDRILIAEARWVTEYSWSGRTIRKWEMSDWVIRCQRLSGGGTFIATETGFYEYTCTGALRSYKRKWGLVDAHRFNDGSVAYMETGDQAINIITSAGKLKTRISLGKIGGIGTFSVLPDGRFLVAATFDNEVVEIDAKGTVHWRFKTILPSGVTRLPNGNTLIASRWRRCIVEVDRSNKIVKEEKVKFEPTRIRSISSANY